ncbi:MAG TPA: hypothetical protein VFR18_11145 [Terriglobia bacterium]|nr:hypothetical protein [Terriglobia bacterium]
METKPPRGRTEAAPLQTRRPTAQARSFPPPRDYSSLSIRDLLDARDAYHVHLSSLQNVMATAVGRYLVHQNDWYAQHPPDDPRPQDYPRVREPRTLANSLVRPWSWPAVLVFVKQWDEPDRLGGQIVPRSLYLPDGRIVPTCVVQATPDTIPAAPSMGAAHVSELLGGGYACLREHQGEISTGTIGCLVRKAGSYYALTNRHVAGGESEIVQAVIRGTTVPIGKTSNIAVDRLLMSTVFPEWAGSRTYLTLDAGLIRIDDIRDWTSQVFGIGEIGEIFDATSQTVTLDLIGCPVRAFGAVTGVAEGEIRALFFRYQSLGGFDYATDVLIGPRRDPKSEQARPLTQPGDSGTMWFYDPPVNPAGPEAAEDVGERELPVERGERARRLRPVALQWGGQRIANDDGTTSTFALASFVSTICRNLDAQMLRDWSLGHDEYWGKTGHFAIGWKACDLVGGTLGNLMKLNQIRIGFNDQRLGEGSEFRLGRGEFVPLADVPDYVWLMPRGQEAMQHFADIDIHDIAGGATMLARCHDDPANISATVWKQYFDGFAARSVGPEPGCLPFRVWQIWDAMVAFLRAGDALRFVASAGVLAHYVGDASQPLHCSYLHHGKPPMLTRDGRKFPVPHGSQKFKDFKKTPASKIHAIYEQEMFEVDTPALLVDINTVLQNNGPQLAPITTGHEAASALIEMMFGAFQRLPPLDIINADNPQLTQRKRAERLWNNPAIRTATVASIVDSVRLLAHLWATAWIAGGGDNLAASKIKRYSEANLNDVCRGEHDTFVPSLSLDDMAASGDFEP